MQAYPHPERLADCQVIRLPYAQEWLTAAECDDLLAFLKASLTQISEIVHRDTKRIAAALTPSVTPRLMDRRIGDWRLLAVEYDHDNCTDEDETDRLDQVLDAILIRDARFCPVLLTTVNEREETIRSAGLSLISCVLRTLRSGAGLIAGFKGNGERPAPANSGVTARSVRGGPSLSACRHRRCGAIRMSPCRLRVHPARFPGLWVNTTLCYRRAVCWLCRAFTLARQPQRLEFAGAAIPG
nr:Uncharacterised protein [Klebsiella pneumoniae]